MEIRRSDDRLISTMAIPIQVRNFVLNRPTCYSHHNAKPNKAICRLYDIMAAGLYTSFSLLLCAVCIKLATCWFLNGLNQVHLLEHRHKLYENTIIGDKWFYLDLKAMELCLNIFIIPHRLPKYLSQTRAILTVTKLNNNVIIASNRRRDTVLTQ